MSKSNEQIIKEKSEQIEALRKLVESQNIEIAELKAKVRKAQRSKAIPKKPISKARLTKLVNQNKSTKSIADHFKVSERTVYRRIKDYGLKGLRPKGRKPLLTKPKPKRKEKWISVERYFEGLNKEYHFVNTVYPHAKFINPKTLVCSNEKGNPEGKFTTIGIYYITLQSGVYFVYRTRIKYTDKPVYFEEIYRWAKRNAFDMISDSWIDTAVGVVKVVAFTFLNPEKKPERVSNLEVLNA